MNSSSRRYRYVTWSLTTVYWFALLVLTHLPPSELPKTEVNDKFAHFTAYGLLAILLYLSILGARRSWIVMVTIILAVLLLYGAFDELTQPLFGRTCSLYDWYADAAGTACAAALMTVLRPLVMRSTLQHSG